MNHIAERGIEMKLLYCKECHDVFAIYKKERFCICGKSKGIYLDNINAKYEGPCIPLGITNDSFQIAINHQPISGIGFNFTAFVIPKLCSSFIGESNK
jgi:hypothetical protein